MSSSQSNRTFSRYHAEIRRNGETAKRLPRAQILYSLADVHGRLGLLAEGCNLAEESLAIREELGPTHPRVADATTNLGIVAEATTNLGIVADRLGKSEESERLLKEALEIQQRVMGVDETAAAMNLNNLGALASRLARFSEAEGYYRRALEIYRGLGRRQEAAVQYREALEIQRERLPEGHPDRVRLSGRLEALRTTGAAEDG